MCDIFKYTNLRAHCEDDDLIFEKNEKQGFSHEAFRLLEVFWKKLPCGESNPGRGGENAES